MNELVSCPIHGSRTTAFVCCHLLQTRDDGVARGLFWSRDEDGCINAYCSGCSDMLAGNGGEWTEGLMDEAGIRLICEDCAYRIFEANGEPVAQAADARGRDRN